MAKKKKSEDAFDIETAPENPEEHLKPAKFAGNSSLTPFQLGKNVFIRTVTYHAIGTIVAVSQNEVILHPAVWVASSGRWNAALDTGTLDEVEPFKDPVLVSRGAIVDATLWRHKVPDAVK